MKSLLSDKGFVWFLGVVEDRDDPIQLGRVRVRCYGYHTDDKDQIPTGSLPWAVPMQGINSAALNGMGHSPTGLVEGSWVVGFFLDGQLAQEPVIMGAIGSIPSEYGNPQKGFFDPRIRDEDDDLHPHSVYPKYINETDVNRLARHNTRNEDDEIIHYTNPTFNATKDSGATLNVPKANTMESGADIRVQVAHSDGVQLWNERTTTNLTGSGGTRYNARYPKNHVYESESGHTVEFDDSPGAERINEHHKSGTFYEVDADGTKVTRIVANNYVIVAGSDNINIKGDVNLTIDSNCRTYIKGDWDIQVDGHKREYVKGSLTQVVDSDVVENYNSNQTTEIIGNLDVDALRIDLN